MEFLANLRRPETGCYSPIIYQPNQTAQLEKMVLENQPILHDELEGMVKELLKIRNPQKKLSESDLADMFVEWSKSNDLSRISNYVYYPWTNKLVRMLREDEFTELRTSRNKFKITNEEQKNLANKKVGVIGLSVGQSVALTMAIERSFGTLRIADFDILELSNLNRIRSGVASVGLKKTTMVAREIAEIDPYLKLEIFDEGITPENLDEFLTGNGPLDLLIEECDSFQIKVLARLKAREKGIAVLMDTSDRGMLDVERFDEDSTRPLFHGKLSIDSLEAFQQLNGDEIKSLLFSVVDFPLTSERLKLSYGEIGKTITTWPQLSSAVTLGGGATAHLARKILLGQKVPSGRFYCDIDQIVN